MHCIDPPSLTSFRVENPCWLLLAGELELPEGAGLRGVDRERGGLVHLAVERELENRVDVGLVCPSRERHGLLEGGGSDSDAVEVEVISPDGGDFARHGDGVKHRDRLGVDRGGRDGGRSFLHADALGGRSSRRGPEYPNHRDEGDGADGGAGDVRRIEAPLGGGGRHEVDVVGVVRVAGVVGGGGLLVNWLVGAGILHGVESCGCGGVDCRFRGLGGVGSRVVGGG